MERILFFVFNYKATYVAGNEGVTGWNAVVDRLWALWSACLQIPLYIMYYTENIGTYPPLSASASSSVKRVKGYLFLRTRICGTL